MAYKRTAGCLGAAVTDDGTTGLLQSLPRICFAVPIRGSHRPDEPHGGVPNRPPGADDSVSTQSESNVRTRLKR